MDKIIIKNLEVFSYHGVNPEEKILGQKFLVDVTLYTSIKKAGCDDNIESTISYSKAIKLLKKLMQEDKYNLLEKVATNLARGLFCEFKTLKKVKICLKKPMAPIDAHFDYVAVKIKRTRKDFFNE